MNQELTDLIVLPENQALAIFTAPDGIDPFLAKIRAVIDGFTPDMTTARGRDEIKSMAFKVARSKTYLEAEGKRLADEQKEIPKKIDATRRKIKETLDAWRDEVRRPVTEWEEAEEKRIAGHQDALRALADLRALPDSTAAEIAQALQLAREFDVSESARHEFVPEFTAARDAAIRALESALSTRQAWEADQAELAALRAEREAREAEAKAKADAEDAQRREEEAARMAREREARIREEAAEKAKADAEARERQIREESAARERDLLEQAERAQREAAETEARIRREAQAKAAAEAADRERREKDVAHKAAVLRRALDALMAGGVDEEAGRLALKLIMARAIPAVSIDF